MAKKLESFITNVSHRVDAGEPFENFSPVLEMICRAYNPGWLLLARWHMETRQPTGYAKAKEELRRFLENDPSGSDAPEAWIMLGRACIETGDALGEIHALIERAQIQAVAFYDVSNAANRLNELLRTRDLGFDKDQRRSFAQRIAIAMDRRIHEANADDLSRMAWLAFHSGLEAKARGYAEAGLKLDSRNVHCQNITTRLGLT